MDLQWGVILQIIQRVCVILQSFIKVYYLTCTVKCLCHSAICPVRHVQIPRLLRAAVIG